MFSCICLFLFYFSSNFLSSEGEANYVLPDHFFINCGSTSSPIIYGWTFTGDHGSSSLTIIPRGSITVEETTNSSSTIELYHSARIFRNPSRYELNIPENGTYVVRFHFFPFSSLVRNLSDARFSVFASKVSVKDVRTSITKPSRVSLLSDFSVSRDANFPRIEEFLLYIYGGKFIVEFVPFRRSFAFVNAMEVFLAPPNLLRNYHDYFNYSNPLRIIHRINVGGDYISPSYNTLLRNWIPDDSYLLNSSLARNSTPYTDQLNYESERATKFDAPNSVYSIAKEMNASDSTHMGAFNITWCFNVRPKVTHFIRVHFCDIVNQNTNQNLRFNLYLYNTFLQEINPWKLTETRPATPFLYDILIPSDDSGFVNISIGPPNDPLYRISFLNGIEIMEIITPRKSESRHLLTIFGSSLAGLVLLVLIVVLAVVCMKRRKTKNDEVFDHWPLISVFGGSSKDKSSRSGSHSLAGLVLLVLIVVLAVVCMKRRKTKNDEVFDHWPLISVFGGSSKDKSSRSGSHSLELNLGLKLTFAEIVHATKAFDANLVIGEGSFGKVYEGMLRNGKKVAVKRSEPGNSQGLHEFETEITLLSKIRHNHLVSLIGYCDEHNEMILVYDFMEKGTLSEHLYSLKEDTTPKKSKLSWDQRLGICIGAAKGINYLHTGYNGKIINRDIKSTNILLDEHYTPKVADFGISRLSPLDKPHVSTLVKGSFGYFDPEYFSSAQLTEKSDVYSFGVVLLEVVCGRAALDKSRPSDEINLAEWGSSWLKEGQLEKIVDPWLVGKVNPDSMRKFSEMVESCLRENGSDRPDMVDVIWNLEYCLKLQRALKYRESHEDSTTNMSWNIPKHVLNRLPSNSITTIGGYEIPYESYSHSDASQVNASGVFSQLKINEAR